MLHVAAIDRLPIDVPTDFILGCAGLGSVLFFATVLLLKASRWQAGGEVDPLRAAGWGGGSGGLIGLLLWLVSVIAEVLFG